MQEACEKYIEAGLPMGLDDPLEEIDDNGIQLCDHLKIGEIRQGSGGACLYEVIAAMKARHSLNPVDKVLGLSMLLRCSALLIYLESELPEHAWARLLRHVDGKILTKLLFAFLLPGENGCYWGPSWRLLRR